MVAPPTLMLECSEVSFKVLVENRRTMESEVFSAAARATMVPAAEARGSDGEKQQILDALERCGGNQTEAAKMLGVSRRTLVYRLDEFGIPRPRKRGD